MLSIEFWWDFFLSFFLSCSFVLTLFIFKAPNYVLARTLTERVVKPGTKPRPTPPQGSFFRSHTFYFGSFELINFFLTNFLFCADFFIHKTLSRNLFFTMLPVCVVAGRKGVGRHSLMGRIPGLHATPLPSVAETKDPGVWSIQTKYFVVDVRVCYAEVRSHALKTKNTPQHM